jgi:hypothetical protein
VANKHSNKRSLSTKQAIALEKLSSFKPMKTISLIILLFTTFLAFPDSTIAQNSPNILTLRLKKPTFPVQKKPRRSIKFIPALTIKPYSTLLDWLNNTTNAQPRKLLKIPVVITFDSYRLGINNAFIGTSNADIEKDTIFLELDDSAMGISLLNRLRNICPKTSNTCAVWLVGYWGSLLDLDALNPPSSSENPEQITKWPFAVREIQELVKQSEQGEQTRVFIQSP